MISSLGRVSAFALVTLMLGACSTAPKPPTTLAEVGELRPGSGYALGYLERKSLPNSLALLPPPPKDGSALAASDLETFRTTRSLRDTPRWQLAAKDANLKFPAAADAFSCAMDMPINTESTPHLTMLLRRTLLDAGLSTYAAKDHYTRPRPFAAVNETMCTPAEEAQLRKDGSYPSGHAALGWAWALVLAELAPERTDALIARGLAFGQSRVICGVHWQSDVDAGRLMGAAAVAKLHSNETFRAQLAAAHEEIAAARASARKSALDCKAEAAALGR